jgi:phosphotransferase system enzyme I (PtsP)
VTPAAVGPLKAMLRTLDAQAARTQVEAWLAKPPPNMRAALTEWVTAQNIEV